MKQKTSKFKVGDRVQIVKYESNTSRRNGANRGYPEGKIFIIGKIDETDIYPLGADRRGWYLFSKELKLVKKKKYKAKVIEI